MTWLGAWTWWSFLVQTIITGANLVLIFVRAPNIKSAGQRAGEVAVVNLTLLFLGPQLSDHADLLNLSLTQMKVVHRGATWLLLVAVAIHVVILQPSQSVFTSKPSKDLYGVIAALSCGTLILLCLRPLRRPCFELFLRSHQILALAILFTTWNHVRNTTTFAQYYTVGIAALLALGSLWQMTLILVRDRLFYRGMPRARIVRVGYAVGLIVYTPFPVTIRPGQYVNVSMPGVSFTSLAQSHPFYVMVVQPHHGGSKLELLIQPRRGWTSKLPALASGIEPANGGELRARQPFLCLFTGPHGRYIDVHNFSVVVLIASDWGVVAHVPYLQALIRAYNDCTTKARRIHLIWQLDALAGGDPARNLLNRALREDTIEDGYIFNTSIYHIDPQRAGEEHRFGRRAVRHEGVADWDTLLCHEMTWQRDRSEAQTVSGGEMSPRAPAATFVMDPRRMIVLVAAAASIRREIQEVCRPHLSPYLQLEELDYQPD